MVNDAPKKKRGRKKKVSEPLPVAVSVSPETLEPVKSVAKSVPQLNKKLLPHELIQTLEGLLIRVGNLESLIAAIKEKLK